MTLFRSKKACKVLRSFCQNAGLKTAAYFVLVQSFLSPDYNLEKTHFTQRTLDFACQKITPSRKTFLKKIEYR